MWERLRNLLTGAGEALGVEVPELPADLSSVGDAVTQVLGGSGVDTAVAGISDAIGQGGAAAGEAVAAASDAVAGVGEAADSAVGEGAAAVADAATGGAE